LAQSYIKGKVGSIEDTFLDHVDYSPSMNSCIAAIDVHVSSATMYEAQVVDVISSERLFSSSCFGDDCGTGKDIAIRHTRDKFFLTLATPTTK
jgi:hypothetical protein